MVDPRPAKVNVYDYSDIIVGDRLGSGSFSDVLSVQLSSGNKDSKFVVASSPPLSSPKSRRRRSSSSTSTSTANALPPALAGKESMDISLTSNCTSMSSSCLDHSENFACNQSLDQDYKEEEDRSELALKRLNARTLADFQRAEKAFYDLHREVEILTKLPFHPHIVRLHGVSPKFFHDPENAFFLQEKLDSNLRVTIQQWRREIQQQQRLNDPWRIMNRVPNKLSRSYQAELIAHIAVDLSSALEFLHDHRVLFRDIKPDNCGLLYGRVKLFDFGFARLVHPDQDRKLTKCLGTLRFLAPEMLWMPGCYSFPVDVYSFGMLLWNLCTLEEPYKNAKKVSVLANMVKDWDNIPSLSRIASPAIRHLLKACWQRDQEQRPSFREIRTILIQDSSHQSGDIRPRYKHEGGRRG